MQSQQAPFYTSASLKEGEVYTRAYLKDSFSITDATINTGIFWPSGTNSIWLFITENKTSDRTQYQDSLKGDVLHFQGQTKGRTDHLIINHQAQDLELLVFYRREKYEYPGAGFRFEGCFTYVSHSGSQPTSFVLQRISTEDELTEVQSFVEEAGEFNPATVEEGKIKVLASIVRRRGQAAFRAKLLQAYNGRCAVTGCCVVQILEAAHIIPYVGENTNHIQNGLLLRADIHTLFDLHLLTINPDTFIVEVAPELTKSEYASVAGQAILLPDQISQQPSRDALIMHQSLFQKRL